MSANKPKTPAASTNGSALDVNSAKQLNSMLLNGNLTAATYQRLSSFAPPRDLTLGGRSAPAAAKKVFTPNLNVVRNKNVNVKTSKDMTATRGRGRGRGGAGGKSERGGARGADRKGSSSLIQTTGVFSEGAGALRKPMASSGGGAYSRNVDDAVSQMRKPVLNKGELKMQLTDDKHNMSLNMRELLGELEDEALLDDKTEFEFQPIKLQEAKWRYRKSSPVKQEIKLEKIDDVSETVADDSDSAMAVANQLQKLHVQQQEQRRLQEQRQLERDQDELFRPQCLEDFLQATVAQLFIMQLPDVLPCETDDADSEARRRKLAESSADAKAADTTVPAKSAFNIYDLQNMHDGRIGKLVRYKSGKVKMILGETQFDIEMGLDTGVPQDLVSLSTNREARCGNMINLGPVRANMINLGPVRAKLTATPDFEHLLHKQQQQRLFKEET